MNIKCPKCGETGTADENCSNCGLLLDGAAAKENLSGLNSHLFGQLERLTAKNLKGEELADEIERSKAVTTISKEILTSAKIQLEAVKFAKEHSAAAPGVIGIEHKG